MTQRPRLGADDDRWQDFRATSRRSLWIALLLIGSYMLAEVAGGLISNSLALLADAGHMVADATAIGLALVAIWLLEDRRRLAALSVPSGRKYLLHS